MTVFMLEFVDILFGEPRDAFSAIYFYWFILCLQNLKAISKSLWSNYRMLLIVLSVVFTFSLSGIIGIAISIIFDNGDISGVWNFVWSINFIPWTGFVFGLCSSSVT